jgi:hypothetical protein
MIDPKEIMYQEGRRDALALQERSSGLTGTELNAEADKIPSFREAVTVMNMLNRPAGFVCRSSAGRVVRLLQPYDSSIFTQEPEELPAQFGFVWSQDPAKARPFVALSTSPYNTGDCCSEEGQVFRSAMDGNVWAPSAYPAGWVAV